MTESPLSDYLDIGQLPQGMAEYIGLSMLKFGSLLLCLYGLQSANIITMLV
jgi:hypothetical protein